MDFILFRYFISRYRVCSPVGISSDLILNMAVETVCICQWKMLMFLRPWEGWLAYILHFGKKEPTTSYILRALL